MAIIAYVYSVDLKADPAVSETIGLRTNPAAGETIKLKDGRIVRVLRVQHNELDGDDQIDIELGVREEVKTS